MRGFAVTLPFSLGAHVALALVLLSAGRPVTPHDEPSSPELVGETFELPAPVTVDWSPPIALPSASDAPELDEPSAPETLAEGPRDEPRDEDERAAEPRQPKRAKPRPLPHPRGASNAKPAAHASGGAGEAKLYGAVGDRSAADLAKAFTRGFPQAASADPVWRNAPLGPAGTARLVLTLDEAGHIEATQLLGTPSPALRSAIQRTLALLKGRTFVARGRVTTLHLKGAVSTEAVRDSVHGDVFAIGGSFAGGEGSAFFSLAIGRRIDLHVRTH